MNVVELGLWIRYSLRPDGEQEMHGAMSEHYGEWDWGHRMGEFVRERVHQGEGRWDTDEDGGAA